MVDVRVQSSSELFSSFLDAAKLLLTGLCSLCKFSCLDSDEPINSFNLLHARVQPSSVCCFLFSLFFLFVQHCLVYRDQHFQERLALILFVNFSRFLIWCTLNGCSEIFSDLRAIKMRIVPIVENIVVSKGISQVRQLWHVSI